MATTLLFHADKTLAHGRAAIREQGRLMAKNEEVLPVLPSNQLFYGNNLNILRDHIDEGSVDLVYLDPPFNSDQDYNVLFAEQDGSRSAAQFKAFGDTWVWDESAEATWREVSVVGGKVSEAVQGLRTLLGTNDMMAYLVMMAPRLVELHRVLKSTGSIYLHCDPTASHYIKILMDAVFGPVNFRNEITWQRTNAHNDSKRWGNIADTLLYYGKSNKVTWNPPRVPLGEAYIAEKYRHDDKDGRGAYQLDNMTSPHPRPNMTYEWLGHQPPLAGWRYSKETMQRLHEEGRIWYPNDKDKRPRLKRYLREMSGVAMGSIWTDIPPLNSQAVERLGFPTQKPEALLDRIITASSNDGDTILDPFCGCGTAVAAAERLGRRWIGIDITHLAINLIKHRLFYGSNVEAEKDYAVTGEPTDLEGARQLADDDAHDFQSWALGLVYARRADQKKGADKGIDGKLFFHDERDTRKTKTVIFSVKSGHTGPTHLRDLRGVLDREKAAIGVMITLRPTTKAMRTEAASCGYYETPFGGGKYPRLQILTVEDLLNGSNVEMPGQATNTTFRKPRRAKGKRTHRQPRLEEYPNEGQL